MNLDKFDYNNGIPVQLYEAKKQHFLGFNRNRNRAEKEEEEREGRLRRFLDGVTRALGNTSEAAALAPLVIFKPVMRNILAKKGFYTSSEVRKLKLKQLVTAFYDKIVKQYENFEGEEGIIKEYMTIPAFRQGRQDIAAAAIVAIASAVFSFIQAMIEKKKSGEPMTGLEDDIANLGDAATRAIENMKDEEISRTVGEYVRDAGSAISNNFIYIVAGVIALIFLMKR